MDTTEVPSKPKRTLTPEALERRRQRQRESYAMKKTAASKQAAEPEADPVGPRKAGARSNHFFFSYSGNKRKEFPEIEKRLNLETVETIVEPFCGSCAVSFELSQRYPKRFKYVLNDADKYLIKLLTMVKEDNGDDSELKKFEREINNVMKLITKEDYRKLEGMQKWFIHHKLYKFVPGVFPYPKDLETNGVYKNGVDFSTVPIITFLKNEQVEITNLNGSEVITKYKDDPTAFIFVDPPYIQTCNDFYTDKSGMNIYEYFYNNDYKLMKSKVLLCLEDNWIIMMLFKGDVTHRYDKTYIRSGKKTTHVVFTNF